MKAMELRELDADSLQVKAKELDDQLFRMRIQKSMGQLEAPGKIRNVRRELARVHTILLNGCECEPYLTTDHRVMAEQPDRVFLGLRIMMRALGVEKSVVGIERNKPDAIAAMSAAAPSDLDVTVLPLTVKYPQGAEKMLVEAVLGVEVPSGKRLGAVQLVAAPGKEPSLMALAAALHAWRSDGTGPGAQGILWPDLPGMPF